MSARTSADRDGIFAHWPNRITAMRLVGSFVLFGVLSVFGGVDEGATAPDALWMQVAFWLFLVVAGTDALDGYLARSRNQITAFGRVADSFCDKVMVLGTMVYLAVLPWSQAWFPAWLVVVVMSREILVTGIRGYVESQGLEFPADKFGKVKFVVQVLALAGAFAYHAFPLGGLETAASWAIHVLVWATLITALSSGAGYALKAQRMLAEAASGDATP